MGQQCESPSDECVHCGTVLPADRWYPVRTERDSSGELVLHYFCSDDCASEWADDGRGDEG